MIEAATWKMIQRFGLAMVGCVVFAGVIYTFIIIPAAIERDEQRLERKAEAEADREERIANRKALVVTNQAVLATNQQNAESNRIASESLKAMAEGQATTQRILERMEWGQARGIWRATEPPKPEDIPPTIVPLPVPRPE